MAARERSTKRRVSLCAPLTTSFIAARNEYFVAAQRDPLRFAARRMCAQSEAVARNTQGTTLYCLLFDKSTI